MILTLTPEQYSLNQVIDWWNEGLLSYHEATDLLGRLLLPFD